MTRRTRRLALSGLFVLAVVGLELPDADLKVRPQRELTAHASPARRPTPVPPQLDRQEINEQDRTSAAHRRRELRDAAARPLLAVLPVELAGVRMAVDGIAADDRTTTIAIDPGQRGRAYASALYRRAMTAYGDPGSVYSVRWVR